MTTVAPDATEGRSRGRSTIPLPEPVQWPCTGGWIAGQYQPAAEVVEWPDDHRPEPRAVLLCNPFGQEAIRCHRAYRVISERLARAGIASLRFDYFGTGDSAGDDGEGDLARWRDDIRAAHTQLKKRAGASGVIWLGLRIGANLALEAAASLQPAELERLVLWDPVVDGKQYLDQLSQDHAFWTRQRGVRTEALGFRLTEPLRAQFSAVDLLRNLPGSVRPMAVLIGADIAGREALVKHLRESDPGTPCIVTDQTTIWSSNEALGSQWVPSASLDALDRLVRGIQ